MMKKLLSILLIISLAAMTFCGCTKTEKNKTLSIVTTIFPEYDWTLNILGEKAKDTNLTLLLDSGVDLHSFQPSADDIIKISTCDIFIYVGGESDKWVDDALKEATNKDMIVLNLLDILGESAKEEELKEGMQSKDEEENEEDEKEYDEHIWLSLRNAKIFTDKIKDAIINKDKQNADIYKKNAKSYMEKQENLDKKYTDGINAAKLKSLIFADRFPFRYLTDDYSLDYFAAFSGCSAESEASFETISFLSKKVDEIKPYAVLTLEKSDKKIAGAIITASNTKNTKILSVDSMQSTTMKDIENGATYLKIMEKNLDVFKSALNSEE